MIPESIRMRDITASVRGKLQAHPGKLYTVNELARALRGHPHDVTVMDIRKAAVRLEDCGELERVGKRLTLAQEPAA